MKWRFWGRPRCIARIEINGVINGATRRRVLNALKVVKTQRFPALLLRIDSPGGTVGDSQEIYSALGALQSQTQIVASFGNIAASGGVYIGMGAPHIVANPGTVTGSIGVILRGNNLEELLKKIGVSFKVVKSGPYKDILAFDRELTPEEHGILQQLIDVSYQQFVHTVATARHLPVERVREFADGRIFTGEQAQALGVVDRLGTEEDARRWAAELAGLDPERTPVRTLSGKPRSLWARLRGHAGSSDFSPALLPWDYAGVPLWLYSP